VKILRPLQRWCDRVQYAVIAPINMGDGSPDPESSNVMTRLMKSGGRQKDVVHYIQLEADADMSQFSLGDIISIHTQKTAILV